jgi:serine/threonine-protein kinase
MALLGVVHPSHAQQSASGKAAAETLFDEGVRLLKENKPEQACPRLEKSQSIDPAVGTLLYLADCYEKTGRIASAWATFREAASAAAAAGQADRAQIGGDRARALESKLSRITLDVGGNAAIVGFKVERDKQSVAPELFGEPIPLDPGEHQFTASAPGYASWQSAITVSVSGGMATVTIPPLNPLPAPLPEPQAPPPAKEPTPAATPVDTAPTPQHHADLTWAWVSGGIGVAGIGAGVFFGLKASDLDKQAKDHCEGTSCFDHQGPSLSKDARDAALIANIGYGVGAVGVGTAIVLAIIAMQDDEPPVASRANQSAFWLAPEGDSHGARLNLQGLF